MPFQLVTCCGRRYNKGSVDVDKVDRQRRWREDGMRLEGRRYDHGQPVSLQIENGTIASVDVLRCGEKSGLPWIGPGLVDLQVNGYGGAEFTRGDLDVAGVEQISGAMDALGVTHYLATVVTQGHGTLLHALRTIAEAIETRPAVACRVAGIHLEGPFISMEEGPRGAHPVEYCRPPDWDEFERLQEAARGHIRLVTLSPEYPSAVEFTRRAAESGLIVAIGHTNANSQQIQAVVDAGARMSTHLGNGAHAYLPRHPNYIWDQLSEDRLVASLIVDGSHLPEAVVKAMVRAKTPQSVVLVSDMAGVAGRIGTEPGLYEETGLGAIEVLEDGRAVVAGHPEYLAGATKPLTVGIKNVMQYAGMDLAAAMDMASARPAQLLGLDCGMLRAGAAADLIQFDIGEEGLLDVLATYQAGTCVWRAAEVGTPKA
ncbi:MAG: amidohydrolase family protein [Pirellulaceae bacterium]